MSTQEKSGIVNMLNPKKDKRHGGDLYIHIDEKTLAYYIYCIIGSEKKVLYGRPGINTRKMDKNGKPVFLRFRNKEQSINKAQAYIKKNAYELIRKTRRMSDYGDSDGDMLKKLWEGAWSILRAPGLRSVSVNSGRITSSGIVSYATEGVIG